MSNEFDDELDRASGTKGRGRARKSEYEASDEGYYLDDDFDISNTGDRNGEVPKRQQPGGPSGRPVNSGNGNGNVSSRRTAGGGVGQPGAGGVRGTGRTSETGQPGAGGVRGAGRTSETGQPGAGGVRSAGSARKPENGQNANGGMRGAGRTAEGGQPGNGSMRGAGRAAEGGQPGNGSVRGAGRAAEGGQPGNGSVRGAGRTAEGGQPGNGGPRITRRTPEGGQSGADGMRGTAGSGQNGSRRQASGGAAYESRRRTNSEASVQVGDYGSSMSGAGGRRGQESGGRMAASRSAAQAAKKKKIRRIVTMAVLEVITLICIGFYGYALRLNSAVNRPAFDQDKVKNVVLSPEQAEHMKGYWPIVVFGVDSRDGNVHTGTNADVIMICNINRDTGEIKLVSVFRDTYLNISEKGTYNKINSAYSNGGAEQALAAINRNLDLDIQDYVTFNWKAVADGINMLGGIDGIDISKAEFRYINSFITETVEKTGVPSVHLKSAGVQHLDGVQAVAYGRLRLMDTDYARTERQRLVIEKAFEKAKKADLGLLNRILLMEVDQVETSLSFGDFTDLILDIGKYHIGETGGFPFARDAMIMGKKGDCVIPQTLESNVAELHKFLYGKENYDPTSQVKKISAKIAADSGMYKQGKSVGHVPTDKGYVPKETEESKKAVDKETESESTSEGETIFETDENGDLIKPTEPGETTEDGTKPVKPGETTADGTKPVKPGETTADGTKPVKPGETTADGTKPTAPGETTDGTKPTGPNGSATDPTRPSAPGGEGSTGPSDSTTGPGVKPTTPYESTSASETTSQGPGGSDGPGGGMITPGASESSEPITVPPIAD